MVRKVIFGIVAGIGVGAVGVAALQPAFVPSLLGSQVSSNAPLADWQSIGPALVSLIDSAEASARDVARAELDTWRERVMAKVDREFLDDRTSYWTSTLSPMAGGVTTYYRCIMDGFDCTEANRKAKEAALSDFLAAFATKVIGPEEAQRDLDAIRRKAEERFIVRINDELTRMPPRWGLSQIGFVRELDRVVVLTADVGNGRLEPFGFASLMAKAATNPAVREAMGEVLRQGVRAMEGCKEAAEACLMRSGMVALGALAVAAVKSGAPAAGAMALVKSVGAGKAVSAGVGAVASIAFVPVVLGAFEWWRHGSFVAEAKPKLRSEIDQSLRNFIDAAVAGDGHIAAAMHAISTQAKEKIGKQRDV